LSGQKGAGDGRAAESRGWHHKSKMYMSYVGVSATPQRLHPRLQYAWWEHRGIDQLHPAGCMRGCNSNRGPGRFACLTSCPTASTRALNFWALPCLRTCVCRGRRGGRVCGGWVWGSVSAGCARAARVPAAVPTINNNHAADHSQAQHECIVCLGYLGKQTQLCPSKQANQARNRSTAMAAKTPCSSRPSTPPSNCMPQHNCNPQQT
jgi:hypothetical protein